MTQVFSINQILQVLPDIDLVEAMEKAFVAYSQGLAEVPPVGELLFPENRGELHIKYGAIKGQKNFVIKVATGFYNNPKLDLPPFGGCMMVLSQTTGTVEAVLLEDGILTNHRTAAAGAVAAKHLAPSDIQTIGIVGAGVQARLQAEYLRKVTDCRSVCLWARDPESASDAAATLSDFGYEVSLADDVQHLCKSCQLIVTTTPASQPLIKSDMVQPGTHITAMGSDTPVKCELDPGLLGKADLVVADSLSQCRTSGEIHHALESGTISEAAITELGQIIAGENPGRSSQDQITVADLTGVAVQDIAIATAVLERLVP